jgi:predicted MFS family arabinose efflux permease
VANSSSGGPQKRNSVKAPLIFSAVLALIAGVATLIFATGGADKELRVDLALIAAGIAFIASLLICSLLLMTEKPNPDHLSEGSGVNRSSAKIPGGAGSVGGGASPQADNAPQAGSAPSRAPGSAPDAAGEGSRPTDPTA